MMGDHLPISKGAVGCAIHGRKIILTLGRTERRASELGVLHRNPMAPHGFLERLQIVAGHLMTESHGTRNAPSRRFDRGRECRAPQRSQVENAIVRYDLDFEIVIARPERAQLVVATLDGGSLTFDGSAPAMQPRSSMRSKSSVQP